MKRRFKLLAVFVGVAAALVVLAAIALPILVDSNHYKREVIALVKQHTGRDLHIDGRVRLRVLPGLRLTVTDVRLGNPPGFTASDLATLASLTVDVKLLPLLAARIETHTVGVRGLTLNLERNNQGRGNWEGLTAAGQDTATQERGGADTPLAAMAMEMAVGGLDIRDAILHWRDDTTGESITIPAITLQTGALHFGSSILLRSTSPVPGLVSTGVDDVRLHATLPGGGATIEARGDATLTASQRALIMPNLTATVSDLTIHEMRVNGALSTRLTADFANQRLTLDALRVSAQASGDVDGHATVEITTGLGFDLARHRLTGDTLSVKVPAFSLSGIDGDLVFSGVLSGDLRARTYALERVRGSGTMRRGTTGESNVAFTLGGALNADFHKGMFSAPGLEIGGSVNGDRLPFRFIADLDITQRQRTLTAKSLRLSIADWQVDGAMTVRAVEAPPGVRGVLDLTVQGQQLTGTFAVGNSPASTDGVDLHLDVVADLDIKNGGYALRGSNAVALRATVNPALMDGTWQVVDLQLDARLADASFPDGKLAVTLRADLEADMNRETVRSDNLRVEVDATRIVGSVEVRRFDRPAVRFDLQADTIDADRYLPPVPASAGGSAQATPLGATIDAIRALDLEGELRVKKLTLKGMQLENVRLTSGGGVNDG